MFDIFQSTTVQMFRNLVTLHEVGPRPYFQNLFISCTESLMVVTVYGGDCERSTLLDP